MHLGETYHTCKQLRINLQAAAYQPPSKCKLKHASARQRLCNKVVQGYVNMEFGQSVLGFLRFSMVAGLNT